MQILDLRRMGSRAQPYHTLTFSIALSKPSIASIGIDTGKSYLLSRRVKAERA